MILISSGTLSFLDALRPPLEARGGADEIRACLERQAAQRLSVLEVLNAGKMPIGQHGVGERPEMFGGLEFGRIRRQKEQMDVLRDAQVARGVPSRAIQDQHNLLAGTGANLLSEGSQLDLEERNIDG